jgi:hypothetical protein
MSIYTIYRRPADAPDAVVLVKEGFSWLAFAFTAFWAVAKGLWVVALMLVSILVLIAVAASAFRLGDGVALALQLAVSSIFGFEARNIWRWSLRRAGYEEIATISGDSSTEAELAYFCETCANRQSSGHERSSRFAPHDTLGLFGNV